MIDKLLREFAKENFGDKEGKYFPVVHGRTHDIMLFMLMVKQPRFILARPFKPYKYTTLGRMEELVVDDKKKEVEALRKKCQDGKEVCGIASEEEDEEEDEEEEEINQGGKEDRGTAQEGDNEDGKGASSEKEFFGQIADFVKVKIKISEDLGSLELGKIDKEHIDHLALSTLLANAELDRDKAKVLEGRELRLITSVIYSQRFAVKGNRKNEVELKGEVKIPEQVMSQLKGMFKKTKIPPNIAKRENTRGPILFKCYRVVYNKEANRLELPKEVVVGTDVFRSDEEKLKEEELEYRDTAVSLVTHEESNLKESFIDEDCKKLEAIKKSVLMPCKNREERKARVNKYLQWFVEALSKGQNKLFLDEPLTGADCKFLRSIFIRAIENSSTLSLPDSFNQEKIQGYAIVLKIISELSEENWDEIEKAWAEQA